MSDMVKMPLKRLSICPCGYHVLLDSIGIGTLYPVDPKSIRGGFRYKCGKCGRWQENVTVINAGACEQHPGSSGPLPYALFASDPAIN